MIVVVGNGDDVYSDAGDYELNSFGDNNILTYL